ncbi:hypothetical protein KSP39_PZI001383 [Platanthera zijinensis]|uniref:DUF3741 domain-containing protein n=1 Tax=Platanthera zijinensis TaxID=2320716 RepID=A0AAP0C0M2_9ASPA
MNSSDASLLPPLQVDSSCFPSSVFAVDRSAHEVFFSQKPALSSFLFVVCSNPFDSGFDFGSDTLNFLPLASSLRVSFAYRIQLLLGEMQGSRSRAKPPRRTADPRPAGRSPAEGSVQSKTRNWLLSTELDSNYECRSVVEEDLITLDFKRHPTKASGMPIKTLIDEEMSREKHARRSSPSLIARLMGLDTLPSPGAFKPLKEVRSFSKKVLSKEFLDNSAINDDSESKSEEHQEEFKDVFEVVQVPKVDKQKDKSFLKENAGLRRHEIGKPSIPQSFSDAINYSTYRMPQRCRQIDDSVEDIDHNNDMFVPILEESSKHHHDQSQKSSFRSGKNVRMHNNRRGNDSQSSRKLAANGYDDASREHMCSILHKFAQSTYAEKNGCSTQPTQIVILKPSLDKSQKAERTRSLNHLQYGLKNPMKFPVGEIVESFIEERGGGQNLHDKLERMGHKIQKPKEISKRNTLSCDRQKVSIQNYNEYEKDNGMCTKSTIMKGKNTQFSLLASAIDCEYSNNYSHSTSSPKESLVTAEARKRLSERWKSTNDFQEMGFLNRESNTLAEMLALSEIDTPKLTPDALAVKKIAGKKSDRDDFLEHRNHPLGISSKDGWKDDFFRSLPRSKSLPESTSAYVNSQLNSRNRSGKIINRNMLKKTDDLNNCMPRDNYDVVRKKNTTLRNLKCLSSKDEHHSDGEENTLAEREIHVSSEELKSSNNLRCLSEKHAAIKPLDDSTKRSDSAEIFSVSQSNTEMNGFEKFQYLTKSGNIVKQFECDEHQFPPKEQEIFGIPLDLLHASGGRNGRGDWRNLTEGGTGPTHERICDYMECGLREPRWREVGSPGTRSPLAVKTWTGSSAMGGWKEDPRR